MYFYPVISLLLKPDLKISILVYQTVSAFPSRDVLLLAESCVCTIYGENGLRYSARYTYSIFWNGVLV